MPEIATLPNTDTRLNSRVIPIIVVKFIALLLALYISKHVADRSPVLWFIGPLLLSILLFPARYIEGEQLAVRCLQLLGLLSALYLFLNYPLIPLVRGGRTSFYLYVLIWVMWVVTVGAGVASLRIPSLAVLPSAYLLWSKAAAHKVTGIDYPTLDVLPLPEVSMCLILGLFLNQVYSVVSKLDWNIDRTSSDTRTRKLFPNTEIPRREFAHLVILTAIGIHMANYFWSFYAKASLPHPPGTFFGVRWLFENNPVNIFLSALDNDHIAFLAFPSLITIVFKLVDKTHLLSNFWVFVIQGAAIVAFWLPKRGLLTLLILFDVMHVSILIITGANFWPWILLNIVLAYIVARPDFRDSTVLLRLLATVFILIAPKFVHVAYLGWYDTPANNKIFFEAVDDAGVRHYVPSNYFAFSSYAFSCFDCVANTYGVPGPETAFATLTNGGSYDYGIFKAGLECDLDSLYGSRAHDHQHFDELSTFVNAYHRLALVIQSVVGVIPYNLYPHHFYIPLALTHDFDLLDKRRIVAYIFRREAHCLGFSGGGLQRDIKSAAEYRIDVRPGDPKNE
jgi:hypothetical protein